MGRAVANQEHREDRTQRQSTPTPRPLVVVGVDGSPSSLRALDWAAHYVEPTHAVLRVVTAWQWPLMFGPLIFPEKVNPKIDAEDIQARALERRFGSELPSDVEALVVEGHPTPTVLNAAKGAELLVLGTRGHGGFGGLLLGSVSEHCARTAECSVVIVR